MNGMYVACMYRLTDGLFVPYLQKFNPCETADNNFKAMSVTQVELYIGIVILVCTEECIYKDVKERRK